jgi:hypothetical protein
MPTYHFIQQSTWTEATSVEANSKEEALAAVQDGNCEWVLDEWLDSDPTTRELTDVEYDCELTQMIVDRKAAAV